MITGTSTQRNALATRCESGDKLSDVGRFVENVKEHWRAGKTPDVVAVLAEHPELRHHKTVVFDLAYQEYLYRQQAGESIDADTFSQRFPSCQKSLQLFIALQSLIPPDLVDAQDIAWPAPPCRFMQYELMKEIGRGSFARVFLAEESDLGNRQVVVKIAPHGGEEAEILGKLRHPNIVPIYSVQKDDAGLTAFCMPYWGRATLCDILDYAFLDSQPPKQASVILDAVEEANGCAAQGDACPDAILSRGTFVDGVIHLAAQIADALAHSHGRGIYHRDLKPSNVLVASDGKPLLLDFNLSVDQQLLTMKVGGTIPYMAPEELAMLLEASNDYASHHYDPRSDIFSLGVIVYELLTGKLPFGPIPQEQSLDELAFQLHQRQKQGPRPLREYNRRVDSRLARLVESCLAFDPDQRPETAQELAVAFRKELSFVRRTRRWMGNHRKRVAGMAAVPLTLVLAVSLFFALRSPYDVRQYRLGLAKLEQGGYSEAVECLNNAVLANPNFSEAILARAKSYHRLGQYQTAYQDYDSVYQQTHDPAMNAYKGYCLNRMKSHKAAIAMYRSALEVGCDSPALLFNNIGYSYLLLGQLNDAEKYLHDAIQADGNLQAPYYNAMKVSLRRALQGQPVSDEVLAYADKAISIGPCTADLYRLVAILYARRAVRHPEAVQPSIKYAKKAIELGFSPKAFASDPNFSTLRQAPAFQEALKIRATTANTSQAIQLLDPLGKS